ncbi:MAG: DNA repair protein RecN [Clostridia bacterium]|nr:DNA repair protein RecN [Clostridia bacterium]
MLNALHIENVAVIRRLDLEFSKGFSVLTGETGAGKSIIIDSINLLLGNRTSRELIRSGESYATVSAVFDQLSAATQAALSELGFSAEDGMLMLSRTIHRDGKSQTRLNGQVITQTLQKEIARMLLSIHGQSDNQKLLQKNTHRELLDAFARPDALLEEYGAAYEHWRTLSKKLTSLTRDEGEKLRMIEMLKFQISDIDALKLKVGEEEALTKERDRLLNAERITRYAEQAYRLLKGSDKGAALDLIARAKQSLRGLGGMVEGAEELEERLEAAASEILDVAESVLGYLDESDEDPTARIDRIEGRLDGISKLKRKYGNSVEEILAFRERAAAQLEETECSDQAREELERKVAKAEAEVQRLAKQLHALRRDAAKEIQALVADALCFLDMPRVQFAVRVELTEPSATGADDVEFLIATNPGEPLLPIIRIASGGELSRIMLALRSVLNDRDGAATVIFDEVDTGVSGKTARKVGIKLKEAATRAQVLCVTHSAQIASLADTHYRITKTEKDGRAETTVKALETEECVEEIARILGGIEITDVQRTAAREMLEEYRK